MLLMRVVKLSILAIFVLLVSNPSSFGQQHKRGSAGPFDRLIVNEHLAISDGAILRLTFLDGFTGQLGDAYQFLNFGTISGQFMFELPELGAGLEWNTSSFLQSGSISAMAMAMAMAMAIPEPGAVLLLSLLAAGGLLRRRR